MIHSVTLLIAQQGPTRLGLFALALLPAALSILLFALFVRRDPSDILYRARYAALLPAVVGIVLGIDHTLKALDFTYVQFHLLGMGMRAAHFAILIVPVLAAAALLFWDRRSASKPKYDF
ncbi:MAG: hypothetical protein MH204_00065 [Fimbriimonadaceae bacterium]|nr:hypothetical protein [Fimbriimonadaceae bacterium]